MSIRYTERLADAGIEPSVGSVGDSYGNALAETVIALFKAELIHRRGPWRSFEAVEFATFEWVDWFNIRWLLEPIGNVPSAEAEAHHWAELRCKTWLPDPNQMAAGKSRAIQGSPPHVFPSPSARVGSPRRSANSYGNRTRRAGLPPFGGPGAKLVHRRSHDDGGVSERR